MFSFFRKKTAPAADAAPAPTEELEPLDADAGRGEPPVEEPDRPSEGGEGPEEEPEQLLTFEEWEKLLGTTSPAPSRRRESPPPAAEAESSRTVEVEAPDEVTAPAQVPAPLAEPPPRSPLEEMVSRCEDDPYNVPLAHELARLAYAAGQGEVAVAPLLRTAALLAGSDASGAIELLTRLLNMRQDNVESDLMLGEMCRSHGRVREAENALRAVLKHDARHRVALKGLVDMMMEAARYPDAIEFGGRLVSLDPKNPALHEKLGDAHALAGNVKDAAEAWLRAAQECLAREDADEALRLYDQVLMVEPGHSAAARERADLVAKVDQETGTGR